MMAAPYVEAARCRACAPRRACIRSRSCQKSLAGRRSPLATTNLLPLGELEAFSRSRLSVLLSLLHARIAREESFLLQNAAQFGAEFAECARDAVLDGAGLPMGPAAVNPDENIKFV